MMGSAGSNPACSHQTVLKLGFNNTKVATNLRGSCGIGRHAGFLGFQCFPPKPGVWEFAVLSFRPTKYVGVGAKVLRQRVLNPPFALFNVHLPCQFWKWLTVGHSALGVIAQVVRSCGFLIPPFGGSRSPSYPWPFYSVKMHKKKARQCLGFFCFLPLIL